MCKLFAADIQLVCDVDVAGIVLLVKIGQQLASASDIGLTVCLEHGETPGEDDTPSRASERTILCG